MPEIQRFDAEIEYGNDFYRTALGVSLDPYPDGELVRFEDHEQVVAAKEKRIKELEAALQGASKAVELHQAELDAHARGVVSIFRQRPRDDVDNALYNAVIGPDGVAPTDQKGGE